MANSSALPATNRVLAELPAKDRAAVLALCEESVLTTGVVIEDPGDEIAHVYFPLSGYISLVMPIDGAASLEVGMVGSEGMYGISLALGIDASPLHAVVQGDGVAWRMSTAAFRKVHASSRPLQRILNQYLYVRMCELAQSAACTRFHVVEARLARWLLMTHDRAHSNRFHLTHAFLAWMLDDNFIFLGSVRYRFAPDGTTHRVPESALGAFTDESLLPVVFPNLLEEVEARLKPSSEDPRVVDIDFANNASALHHVDPLDNVIVREWGEAGELLEATVFLGRLAKVAFTQKAADIPLLRQKHDWLLAHSGELMGR